jgi:hypothetical protein
MSEARAFEGCCVDDVVFGESLQNAAERSHVIVVLFYDSLE